MDNNRKTAYLSLMDIEVKKAYSNLALNHHVKIGKPGSAGFVRKLVYGVLENKIYLDHIIKQLINKRIEDLDMCCRIIIRMGIYQLDFMDSVPDYAAVRESVNLAKRFCAGRDGFINAVLRNYLRSREKISFPDEIEDVISYLSVKYSYNPWIIELWLKHYDRDFVEALLDAGNRTPDLVIRPNLLKTSKKELKKKLLSKGYFVSDGNLAKDALHVKGEELLGDNLYSAGMFSVQDESSMIAVTVLDPKPGERIIDVCAAPGGKTVYMAERMENRGEILAQDIYKKKLDLIRREAERNGISIVTVRAWDAVKMDSSNSQKADRVLVDAPCSGLGVIRRKPEIKYKEFGEESKQLPIKQLQILTSSSSYVKSGGVLVYSTCTINPDENQEVIQEFLKNNPFDLEETIQLYPHINNTDGFFICKMVRK